MPLKATNDESRTARGALIAHNGQAGKSITPHEYGILLTCLALCRSDNRELRAIAETINYIREPETRTFARYMNFLVDNIGEHITEYEGMLVPGNGNPVLIEDGQGVEAVADFVKVLRQPGWFAEWIAVQVKTIAAGNPPSTPLMVMQSLTDDLEQFNLELITARRMYEQHPELVAPKDAAQSAAQG